MSAERYAQAVYRIDGCDWTSDGESGFRNDHRILRWGNGVARRFSEELAAEWVAEGLGYVPYRNHKMEAKRTRIQTRSGSPLPRTRPSVGSGTKLRRNRGVTSVYHQPPGFR